MPIEQDQRAKQFCRRLLALVVEHYGQDPGNVLIATELRPDETGRPELRYQLIPSAALTTRLRAKVGEPEELQLVTAAERISTQLANELQEQLWRLGTKHEEQSKQAS